MKDRDRQIQRLKKSNGSFLCQFHICSCTDLVSWKSHWSRFFSLRDMVNGAVCTSRPLQMHFSTNVICSGPGENAPQVHITATEVQNPSLLGVKYFLSCADLTTQGSFVLRVLSCVDSHCSLSFSGDCPFAYTFWRLISLKAFYTLPNCSKEQLVLGTGVHLSNLVFWRGSWYKFSFCPYFEPCSYTQLLHLTTAVTSSSPFPTSWNQGWSHEVPPRVLHSQSCQLLVL